MNLMQFAILLCTLLCSLVAGLVFTFAVVVMPGIRTMGYLEFLKSFKAMDRVIQNNHPIFMLVWLGSVVALIASTVLGIWQLEGVDQMLLGASCLVYLFVVQLPTFIINIPLNNHLQSCDLDSMSDAELMEMTAMFDSRWLKWNAIRTVLAALTTTLLLILLTRL